MSATSAKECPPATRDAYAELLSATLDALDIAVVVFNQHGMIRYRNAEGQALVPGAQDLIAALRASTLSLHREDWCTVIANVVRSGQPFESTLTERPDQALHLKVNIRPISAFTKVNSECGDRLFLMTVSRDSLAALSDQTPPSAPLQTAHLVHELNNPLDGVLRYINLAIRLLQSRHEPQLSKYLDESRTGLMRMTQIIGDLLQHARRPTTPFDESDINEIVEQAVRNFGPLAEQLRVVVIVDFQFAKMPRVRGSRLYQVCCNLLKNALEAMPDGGRLMVTTGIVEDHVMIRVADTGIGLPLQADRLFEPYFTTKPKGEGVGLGLALCKRYVQELGGQIDAKPGEEGGAVFSVRIPVLHLNRIPQGTRKNLP